MIEISEEKFPFARNNASVEPLIIQPAVARDGAAISEQFTEQTGTVLLYIALIVALIAIVVLITMNRQLSTDHLDLDLAEQTLDVVDDMDTPPPPPGFDVDAPPPPPPPSGFDPNATPSPPDGYIPDVQGSVDNSSVPEQTTVPQSAGDDYAGWTDEMLMAQGWTQWQVDTWRAQQGGSEAPQSSADSVEDVAEPEEQTTDEPTP